MDEGSINVSKSPVVEDQNGAKDQHTQPHNEPAAVGPDQEKEQLPNGISNDYQKTDKKQIS